MKSIKGFWIAACFFVLSIILATFYILPVYADWSTDLVSPTISVTSVTGCTSSGNTFTCPSGTTATVNIGSCADGESGIQACSYDRSDDGGTEFIPFTPPSTSFTMTGSGQTKTVTLKALDNAGNTNTGTTIYNITFSAPLLDGTCSVSTASAVTGQNVTWTATPTGGISPYNYSWTGTDSLTGTSQSVVKSYSTTGIKTASVTFTDSGGGSYGPVACSNNVNVTTAPQSDLYPSSLGLHSTTPTPKVGDNVSFTAIITNGGTAPAGQSTWTSFQVDSQPVNLVSTPDIAAGNNTTVNWLGGWTAIAGIHTLTICADYTNLVIESNESNCANTTFSVFDYSLSNSGGITAAQGNSGSNTITRTLLYPTSQAVTLSASGLPSGASASFTSNPCNPTCSSTLTISTSSSTPTGSYTITVTGTPLNRTTTFTLTVTPAQPGVFDSVAASAGCSSGSPIVTVTWQASTNATSYDIWRSVNGGSYSFYLNVPASISYTDSSVSAGSTYSYFLWAKNGTAPPTQSTNSSNTVTARSDCAGAPSVSCSVSPTTAITGQNVTWTATPSGGAGAPWTYSWTGTDSLTGSSASVVKSYATTGTKTASVNVTDSLGNSSGFTACSNNVLVTPPSPGPFDMNPPTTSCSGSFPRISVSWTASTNATSYDVYRNVNGGSYFFVTNVVGSPYLDTSVTTGSSYRYYAVARNGTAPPTQSNTTTTAVVAPACASPSPSPSVSPSPSPLPPTVNLLVDTQLDGSGGSISITAGSSHNLTWSSTNATSCSASAIPVSGTWTGSKAVNNGAGESTGALNSPPSSYSFRIDCFNASYPSCITANCSDTVNLNLPATLPWLKTTGGDVHTNTTITAPGGP